MDGDRPGHGSFAPVRLPSRRPPVERWVIIAAVITVLVIAKPWSSPNGGAGSIALPLAAPSERPPTPVPTPSSSAGPGTSRAASFCLDTSIWLVASVERSVERSVDERIRVWRALEPVDSAKGPEDPSIPIVSIVSEGLTQLGWCAPIVGDVGTAPVVNVTTWFRTLGGVVPVKLDPSEPGAEPSPYGAMYLPPRAGPGSEATSWPDGTIVFRYRMADGRERWFAVDVETRPVASPAG